MGLIYKTVRKIDRGMYLYYPEIPRHNPHLVRLVTVIRGDSSKESVEALLDGGLRELAEKTPAVLAFPDPLAGGWNHSLDDSAPDDLEALDRLLDEVSKEDDEPLKTNAIGIPELSEMLRQWHLMNLARYMVGTGEGASMAYAYAACRPANVAAVCGFGGGISDKALSSATDVPVTAVLSGASAQTAGYFRKACGAKNKVDDAHGTADVNPVNEYAYVRETGGDGTFDMDVLREFFSDTVMHVRRLNTGKVGDLCGYSDLTGEEFTWFMDDESLGDGLKHTWLVHVPSTLPEGERVPLVIFYHGGSDNPTEAAHMARLHELGRKEHFITVYPWGSDTASWNINYDARPGDDGTGDERYGILLIDHLLKHYPVDPGRVYLSGFSNGAAMAQVIAMLYPGKIAGLMHIDSNWPGNRWKPTEIDIHDVPAMRRALEQKAPWMRMPVWYTYGTREASCPVWKGSTQQYQYDFWKQFNNIEIKPTPRMDVDEPCESGVRGDESEKIYPIKQFPDQYYTVERFYSQDDVPGNYYNYCLMHDKGHEVAPMDAVLGWQYVKQFIRLPDGHLSQS